MELGMKLWDPVLGDPNMLEPGDFPYTMKRFLALSFVNFNKRALRDVGRTVGLSSRVKWHNPNQDPNFGIRMSSFL